MVEGNALAWDRHARRYSSEGTLPVGIVDYYGVDFPTERDLAMIGDPKGLTVLELGSGACNCGIALAIQGATVTCLDLSSEQLKIGREDAASAGVSLECVQGDMEDLSALSGRRFDLVLSVCALMYVLNISAVFRQVAGVLRPGGRFIFSVDHPIFMAIGATELWPDEGADPDYSYQGAVKWRWLPEDEYEFTTFRRPVSEFVNALHASGLCIQRMVDLYPTDFSKWGPTESRLRRRFPSAMMLLSTKPA